MFEGHILALGSSSWICLRKPTKVHGKQLTERSLFVQPREFMFLCFLRDLRFGPFFDRQKLKQIPRFSISFCKTVVLLFHKRCRTWVKLLQTSSAPKPGDHILNNHCLTNVSISGSSLDPKFPVILQKKGRSAERSIRGCLKKCRAWCQERVGSYLKKCRA